MRKRSMLFIIISGILLLFFYLEPRPVPVREAVMTHPTDPFATFTDSKTTLSVLKLSDEDEYVLDWETSATLNSTAYLLQDVSLLYEDGRLKETLSAWEENSDKLHLQKKIKGEDSGFYEAITLHFAEFHYPNDVIKGKQQMSYDKLYVIDSPLSPLHSFKEPTTEREVESKQILDTITNQQLSYIWKDLISFYQIPIEKYSTLPITMLDQFQEKPLPGIAEEASKQFMTEIWSTIYKEYYLGITKEDETVISPLGSSLPLLIYSENADHFMILFQLKDGERVQLLRTLPREFN